jgi:hypothetical protein
MANLPKKRREQARIGKYLGLIVAKSRNFTELGLSSREVDGQKRTLRARNIAAIHGI